MLFVSVFIAAEIRAAEACGVAFFNLAMLSDAEAARGGAMTCHSILNPNLHVYDNGGPRTASCKIVRGAARLKSSPEALPFLNSGHRGGFRTRNMNLQAGHIAIISERETVRSHKWIEEILYIYI